MLCPSCEKAMESEWVTCPFCSTSLSEEDSSKTKSSLGYANPLARVFAFLIDTAIVAVVFALILPVFTPLIEIIPGGGRNLQEALRSSGFDLWLLMEYGRIDTFGQLVLLIAVIVLYHGAFEGSSRQATIGKMIFKIRVTDRDGNPLGFSGGFLRALVRIPSLCLGFLSLLFFYLTEGSRAIHDFYPGSVVRG